jgi:hypothetical protein
MLAASTLAFAVAWNPAHAQTTSTLSVSTVDTNGRPVYGYYAVLNQSSTSRIATGFTPTSFTLDDGVEYWVQVDNYGACTFSQWVDSGSRNDVRAVSISSNTQLVAQMNCNTTPNPSTPSIVQFADGLTTGGSGTSVSFTFPHPVTSGDVILVCTGIVNGNHVPITVTRLSDSVSTNFGWLDSANSTSPFNAFASAWAGIVPTSGTDTVTLNYDLGTASFFGYEISGTGINPQDFKYSSEADQGVSKTQSSVLAYSPDRSSLVVACGGFFTPDGSGTVGADPGYTLDGSFNGNAAVEHLSGFNTPYTTSPFSFSQAVQSWAEVSTSIAASTTSTLSQVAVNSHDTQGNTITGYYTVLYNDGTGGSVASTGFTPVTFSTASGQDYRIQADNYGSCTFVTWSDGINLNPRPITAWSSEQTYNAIYDCSGTSTLTVSTANGAGSDIYGYYITLWQGGAQIGSCFSTCSFTVNNGMTYQLEAASYGSESFSHWQNDGSPDAETVIVAGSSSTLYYTAIYTP